MASHILLFMCFVEIDCRLFGLWFSCLIVKLFWSDKCSLNIPKDLVKVIIEKYFSNLLGRGLMHKLDWLLTLGRIGFTLQTPTPNDVMLC